jgi:hypothetical protein
MLRDGLDVTTFLDRAFSRLLADKEFVYQEDLVVSRDGQVVGMNMLWVPSVQQQHSLSIRVQPGLIRKDGAVYDAIREDRPPIRLHIVDSKSMRVPVCASSETLVGSDIQSQLEKMDQACTFDFTVATKGSIIEIRHYLVYPHAIIQRPVRRYASWLEAIRVLSTAAHMKSEPQRTPQLVAALHSRIGGLLSECDVSWVDPFVDPVISQGTGTLMRTANSVTVKVCGSAALSSICCRVIVRHRSYLLQCIERASSESRTWIVID